LAFFALLIRAADEQKSDAPIAHLTPSQLPADGLFVAHSVQ
jgi:hypothetical protein